MRGTCSGARTTRPPWRPARPPPEQPAL